MAQSFAHEIDVSMQASNASEQAVRNDVAKEQIRVDNLATRNRFGSVVARAMVLYAQHTAHSRDEIERLFHVFMRKKWNGSNLKGVKDLDMSADGIGDWVLCAYVLMMTRHLQSPPKALPKSEVDAWRRGFYKVFWLKALLRMNGSPEKVNRLLVRALDDLTVNALDMPARLVKLFSTALKGDKYRISASYVPRMPGLCLDSFTFGPDYCQKGEEDCEFLHGDGNSKCEHKEHHPVFRCGFVKGLSDKSKTMLKGAIRFDQLQDNRNRSRDGYDKNNSKHKRNSGNKKNRGAKQ